MKITIINALSAYNALASIKFNHSEELNGVIVFKINEVLSQLQIALTGYHETVKELAAPAAGKEQDSEEFKKFEEEVKKLQMEEIEIDIQPLSIYLFSDVKLKNIEGNINGVKVPCSPLDFLKGFVYDRLN